MYMVRCILIIIEQKENENNMIELKSFQVDIKEVLWVLFYGSVYNIEWIYIYR